MLQAEGLLAAKSNCIGLQTELRDGYERGRILEGELQDVESIALNKIETRDDGQGRQTATKQRHTRRPRYQSYFRTS